MLRQLHFSELDLVLYRCNPESQTPCCLIRSGTQMLRQLHFSELDLVLHSRYAPQPGATVFESAEVKAVEARTTVMPPLPEDRWPPSLANPKPKS